MVKRWLCCLLLLTLALPSASQGPGPFTPRPFDWPQWQGPQRDNRSPETGLLRSWPKDGPPLVWQAKGLGGGYSTPSIAAGRLFGMSYRQDDEVVWALDERTGKELWAVRIASANRTVDYHEGSRCTPTVDGERLYALGVSGDLVCLLVEDGKELWSKNLIKDFGGTLPYYREAYGYTESPLIDGERVVVTPGEPRATLVALDKRTGKTLLTASVPETTKGSSRAEYASVVVGEAAGRKQYVQFLHGGVVGVAADDGRLLWRYDRPSSTIVNCLTPVFHEGHVFAASGYGKGGGLVRIENAGGQIQAREVYFSKRLRNLHGGVVLVDGYLYGSSDPGMLVCLEFATGKGGWEDRRAGRGSILYADGHLYYRDERGPMLLIEANPKAYVEKGRFDPPGHNRRIHAWAHPVIANGLLYLRDQDLLLCYDVKQR
ncbi:MAG: PQQ-like beta-propeller repeat protein [Gemmataceae bacterium]|nr:PQQ-like beta-propeller repeat protein [Gemmataceae bacterium]